MAATPNIMITSSDIDVLAGNLLDNSISGNLSVAKNITANTIVASGNVVLNGDLLVGHGVRITSSTGVNAGNATVGQASLVIGPGAVTIYTTAVLSTSLIFLTHADNAGNGSLYALASEIVPGVSFTVKSMLGGGNADKFNWLIINQI